MAPGQAIRHAVWPDGIENLCVVVSKRNDAPKQASNRDPVRRRLTESKLVLQGEAECTAALAGAARRDLGAFRHAYAYHSVHATLDQVSLVCPGIGGKVLGMLVRLDIGMESWQDGGPPRSSNLPFVSLLVIQNRRRHRLKWADPECNATLPDDLAAGWFLQPARFAASHAGTKIAQGVNERSWMPRLGRRRGSALERPCRGTNRLAGAGHRCR